MDALEAEVVRLDAALREAREAVGRHERGAADLLASERLVAELRASEAARLQAERQQHVLNQELSHRLKNTFAMVQAIAAQTLKGVAERALVETFRQRLAALGTAHDVLLQQSWAAAPIGTIVGRVLALNGAASRVIAHGPVIELGSKAVLQLSLLLHELATNAVKHGALSVEAGQVAVAWTMEGLEDAKDVVLTWTETGGPPAGTPTRTGFGSRLILTGLSGTGGADLRYAPTGFHAEFRSPLGLLTKQ